MVAGNAVNANQTGIQTFTGTAFTGSTVTQHGVLIGGASNSVSSTGVGSTGQVLQGVTGGDPTYSTSTFPSTATNTGTLLRADGTNWVPTTSTYPNTNAINTLLYASAANVMSALPTANNGTLVTSSTGVPSILAGPGTTGNILQSNAAAAPSFSTATYPSTATSAGTILRADGTNWVATTATYPATTTSQQILYSTAANVIGQLTTANSALAATNSSGTLAMRAFSVVIQTFTANGTYTPTSGMLYCIIEVVGSGGGGGGSASTSSSQVAYGGGGGGGEYARGVFSAATVGASQSVTCPAGGAGGTAGANNGTGGSTTSVGALISAAGGSGGIGATANGVSSSFSGGDGGTGGTGGSFRFKGTPGITSVWIFGSFQLQGRGATGPFSGGTLGSVSTATGATGTGYGGGGGGGQSFTSAAAQAGGAGASGLVVITEFVIA